MNKLITTIICCCFSLLLGYSQTIVSYQPCDNCSSPEQSPFNEDGTPYFTYLGVSNFTLGQCSSDYGPRNYGGYKSPAPK